MHLRFGLYKRKAQRVATEDKTGREILIVSLKLVSLLCASDIQDSKCAYEISTDSLIVSRRFPVICVLVEDDKNSYIVTNESCSNLG